MLSCICHKSKLSAGKYGIKKYNLKVYALCFTYSLTYVIMAKSVFLIFLYHVLLDSRGFTDIYIINIVFSVEKR
jgi:hypothetical protein